MILSLFVQTDNASVLVVKDLAKISFYDFNFALDDDEDFVCDLPLFDNKVISNIESALFPKVVKRLGLFEQPVAHVGNLSEERNVLLQLKRFIALKQLFVSFGLNHGKEAPGEG